MDEANISVSEIAARHGLSAKTVQRVIKEHPEIGVVMVARKKTMLTQEQASQVSAYLSSKTQDAVQERLVHVEVTEKSDTSQNTETVSVDGMTQDSKASTSDAGYRELMAQIVALTERAARAEGRAEMLERQVADLQSQRTEAAEERRVLQTDLAGIRRLLEDAEAKAARAQAEADSYRPSVFGFYRKSQQKRLEAN